MLYYLFFLSYRTVYISETQFFAKKRFFYFFNEFFLYYISKFKSSSPANNTNMVG